MQKEITKPTLMLSDEIDVMIPYSRAHLYRLEDQGLFPKRRRIGPNRIAWVRSEVDQWLNNITGDES
ncbi:AlpA family transcriptional regulator [Alphaproteobacteria bacterium]|jgi:predicted DNA-binding transcriptional regulator AlpA|nr:AlpA family transcriptional regulator [Alphaproteobacteria bacterium]|tara:strand:+ start:2161 stop:2361 length:201 start_codon:yes stop_codon:yes gene_type:complete